MEKELNDSTYINVPTPYPHYFLWTYFSFSSSSFAISSQISFIHLILGLSPFFLSFVVHPRSWSGTLLPPIILGVHITQNIALYHSKSSLLNYHFPKCVISNFRQIHTTYESLSPSSVPNI